MNNNYYYYLKNYSYEILFGPPHKIWLVLIHVSWIKKAYKVKKKLLKKLNGPKDHKVCIDFQSK